MFILTLFHILKLLFSFFTGPDLPFTVDRHSMIQFDEKSIYLIGGMQNYTRSNASDKTWVIDPNTVLTNNEFCIRQGPSLNQERSEFACGKMKLNEKNLLVVAGGNYLNSSGRAIALDSIEILDPLSDKGWIFGNF